MIGHFILNPTADHIQNRKSRNVAEKKGCSEHGGGIREQSGPTKVLFEQEATSVKEIVSFRGWEVEDFSREFE